MFQLGREAILLFLLFILLLLADRLCYQQALPVVLDERDGNVVLHVGSETVPLGEIGRPVSVQFVKSDPAIHEYQLDGSDRTNNFTTDISYLDSIASSPYYLFQSWMRDLNGTSRWSDLRVFSNGHLLDRLDWPANGEIVSFPQASSPLQLQVMLQRPETPRTLSLTLANNEGIQIQLNRNDRKINVLHGSETIATAFFPVDVLPFAAMVVDFLVRTLAWAIVLLLVVMVYEVVLLTRSRTQEQIALVKSSGWRLPLHPVALVALPVSFFFVAWIASVQYHGEPHIYDASAYLFSAKMYATGHLSVPVPPAVDRFPGPFMVVHDGKWFGQYAPGTALSLAPGVVLGVPWLVEPILGTFALFGIGLIAARLFDRRVATLSVLLGALSPFYAYIAASYLSHAVALFYLVWGLWALLRFFQGEAWWNLPLSAFFFGMGYLTRDLPTLLFIVVSGGGLLLLFWRQGRNWKRPGLFALAIAVVFFIILCVFNASLTGSPWVTPRALFFAGDHWGFGDGVGFYGKHTLAAGFMNLDELLTILAIDLYGWPFYLSLAFIALPFLTRRARGADWFCLIALVAMIGAYIGYFYHGIYLGPRYLFESLPFLLILTARGIVVLAEVSRPNDALLHRIGLSVPVAVLLTILTLLNLLYFLPRQVVLHQDYTGLPNGTRVDVEAIYSHPSAHNALVVTSDYLIYQMVLFPLNDPYVRGDVIYAWASNAADYNELRSAFPNRQLYRLDVAPDGTVNYSPIQT